MRGKFVQSARALVQQMRYASLLLFTQTFGHFPQLKFLYLAAVRQQFQQLSRRMRSAAPTVAYFLSIIASPFLHKFFLNLEARETKSVHGVARAGADGEGGTQEASRIASAIDAGL